MVSDPVSYASFVGSMRCSPMWSVPATANVWAAERDTAPARFLARPISGTSTRQDIDIFPGVLEEVGGRVRADNG
jgi:hypothetical protein